MIVKIAGGASIMDDMNYFRIGQKNITAARKIFWRNGIIIDGEDLHGNYNRTVKLNISNGKFYVKNFANLFEEL
jgi:chemotaxis protein CheD